MMFHRYEEDKPSAESNAVLYHDPNRYPHDLPENPELETPFAKEVVLLIIYILERNNIDTASEIEEAMAAPLIPKAGNPNFPNIRI